MDVTGGHIMGFTVGKEKSKSGECQSKGKSM